MNISNLVILFLNVSMLKYFFLILPFALDAKKESLDAMTCKSIEYVVIAFQNTSVEIFQVNNHRIILNNHIKEIKKICSNKISCLIHKKNNNESHKY